MSDIPTTDINDFFRNRGFDNLGDYDKHLKAIQDKKLVVLKTYKGCNMGRFYECVTQKQFDSVIEFLFNQMRKRAEEFYEFWKNNVVCDGLIFSTTRKILNEAITKNTLDYKLAYITCFNFACDGNFIAITDRNPSRVYSEYCHDIKDHE